MTDTIEAVAREAACDFMDKCEGFTPLQAYDLARAFQNYAADRIAAHTKALVDGAGELCGQLTGRAQFCEDRGEVKSPSLMREAAATIAALKAENERLAEERDGARQVAESCMNACNDAAKAGYIAAETDYKAQLATARIEGVRAGIEASAEVNFSPVVALAPGTACGAYAAVEQYQAAIRALDPAAIVEGME